MVFENEFDRGFFLGFNHGRVGMDLLDNDTLFSKVDRTLDVWKGYEIGIADGINYREGYIDGLFALVNDTGYNNIHTNEMLIDGYNDGYMYDDEFDDAEEC